MVGELLEVTKRYRDVTAVQGLSLQLEAGRVTALLGPNGAGKTTTVRLLLGAFSPNAPPSSMAFRRARSFRFARRIAKAMNVVKAMEKPAGMPRLRSDMRASLLPASVQM
jgi:ABC-2 type transport system ATP-binding protein